MAIHVRWEDTAKTIVYCEYEAEWTLDDFHNMIDETYTLVTSVNHPVSVINDYTKSHVPPRQWLSTGRHIEKRQSPNSDLSIVVGANAFVKVMLTVAQKLFLKNLRIYAVDTLQEAHQIIDQHRQLKVA